MTLLYVVFLCQLSSYSLGSLMSYIYKYKKMYMYMSASLFLLILSWKNQVFSMMSACRSLWPSTMVSCFFLLVAVSCTFLDVKLHWLLFLKSRKVLETATRSKKHETIVEGQSLRKADIMESKCSSLRFHVHQYVYVTVILRVCATPQPHTTTHTNTHTQLNTLTKHQ